MTQPMTHTLFTIGYEKRTVDDVLQLLDEANIKLLFDVRYRPQSRKPGLSKTKLAAACEARGIAYTHDRRLGTPPDIMRRIKAEKGYTPHTWDDYRAFLATQEDALSAAVDLVREQRACLLCYELKPEDCHRRIVAQNLRDRLGLRTQVIHL